MELMKFKPKKKHSLAMPTYAANINHMHNIHDRYLCSMPKTAHRRMMGQLMDAARRIAAANTIPLNASNWRTLCK